MLRQQRGGRVVEDERRGQAQTGGGSELVTEVDRGERVESEVAERLSGRDGVGSGIAQDRRDFGADEGEQQLGAVGRGEPEELAAQGGGGGRLAVLAVRGVRDGLPGLGQLREEGTAPGAGEDRCEAVPRHVGHGHRCLAVAGGPAERGQCALGVHGRQPIGPQVRGETVLGGVRPGPPRDRQSPGAVCAAPLCHGVQVGARRGAGALAADAPDTGDRREQHERVELPVTDHRFQALDVRVDLGEEHVRLLRCGAVECRLPVLARVDDRGEREALGDRSQSCGERLAVGHLAGGQGEFGAQVGELGPQFGDAGAGCSVGAGRRFGTGCLLCAEQQDVFGAVPGEPAGDVTAEALHPAGDQHRAGRLPGGLRRGRRDPDQSAREGSRGPQGDLVLAERAGHDAAEPVHRALVEHVRCVDEAAPPRGVVQGGDAAEPPDRRLDGALERLGTSHRHRTPGHAPQGGVDSGVCQRPQHGVRPCQARRQAPIGGRGGGGEQGDDARVRGVVVGEPLGEAGGIGDIGFDAHRVGADRSDDCGEPRVVRLPGGEQHQPRARGDAGRCRTGQGLPAHAVAPAVHDGRLVPLAAPGGQGRHQGRQGRVVQVQRGRQRLHVLSFHRRPECGVHGVLLAGDNRCGRALGPVPLALEGVRRQVDAAGAGAGEQGRPVHVDARHVEPGEGGEQRGLLRPVLAQGRYDHPLVAVQALLGHGGEHAVRPQFQERGRTGLGERLHPVGEAHGLADVAHPVVRAADQLRRRHLTRHVRHQRNLRRGVGQRRRDLPELLQHRIHQGRMERVADRQALGLTPLSGELLRDPQHRGFVTGDDDRAGAVDRRDRHPLDEPAGHLGLGRLDRDHRTARRQRLHQPRPGRHQRARVIQGQHPGDMRSSDLTDRVPGQEVGSYAPGLHETEQRHLDREQRRLRKPGLAQRTGVIAEQHLPQRALQLHVEPGERRVQRLREHREPAVQLTAHPQSLRTLAGEQERRLAGDRVGDAARGLRDRSLSVGQEHRTVRERRPARGQGVSDVDGGLGRLRRGERREPFDLCPQRLGRLAGDRPRHHGRHDVRHRVRCGVRCGLLRLTGFGERGGLLDDDVGVRTADAEGGHACPARSSRLRPCQLLLDERHRAVRPVDVRGGGVDVQRPGQRAVPHRHDHLDDAGDARRGLGVPQVRLDRAEEQRTFPVAAVRRDQGVGLDGVAEGGAGAVGLHGVDVRGGQAGVGEGLADHALLCASVGGGQAVGGAVLVDGRAAHDAEDVVSVAAGVGEPFQYEHAGALGPCGAVRRVGEGLAAAVGGQPALRRELDEGIGAGHHRDAAGEHEGAFAAAQGPRGHVQGDQGGGAGGVDGHGRALEAQRVGQASGHDARRIAGGDVSLDVGGAPAQHRGVVLAVGADVDAGLAAAQPGGVDAGALQGLPGGLEQQALLRVHRDGFARGDTEEGGVEAADAFEEAAFEGGGGASGEGVQVPAAVGRESGDRVLAAGQQAPQVFGGFHTAGEAAAHAHDRDGVVVDGPRGRCRGVLFGHRAEELGEEEFGQGERGGVVVDERRRQAQARRRREGVAQFDGGQRVEAEVAERLVGADGVGVGVAEDRSDLAAQDVQDEPCACRLGQARQPLPQRRLRRSRTVRAAADGGEGVAYLGQVADEGVGPECGEDRGEAVPVDVGEGEGRVVVLDGVLQCGEGELRCHGGEAATAYAVFDARSVDGHACLGPGTPGERGRGQAVGPPVFRERVEEGVGGGVVALPGGAEGARGRGEQDEGAQAEVPRQLVQVHRRGDLRAQYGRELLGGQGVENAVVDHAGGVDDRGEREVLGHTGQHGREGVAVRSVAGGQGDLGTESGELGAELFGARCLRAPAADEQQVLGAPARQPAGDVAAQSAGAAGDQHGAGGGELVRRGTLAGGVTGQAAYERSRGPDGDLVLAVGTGEDARQAAERGLVERARQVHQAAPALRLLQADDAAQAPYGRLCRCGEVLGAADGDGFAGHAPQGCVDAGVAERLHGCRREQQAGGGVRLRGRRVLVQGQQGQDAGEAGAGCGQFPQAVGQGVPVVVGDLDADGLGGQGVDDGVGPVLIGRACGGEDQPRPRGVCRRGTGEGLPDGPVAPAVDGGLCAAPAAPRRQCGHHGGQGVVVEFEGGPQRRQVGTFHRRPEFGVHRVGRGVPRRRGARDGLRPVALPLERVGRQVDAAYGAVGEHSVPVHLRAVHVQPCEGARERGGLGAVAAQCRDSGDLRRLVEGLPGGAGEDAVGAEFEEGGHAQVGEPAHGVGEADRGADLSDPVLRGAQLLGRGELAGDSGDERDRRSVVGHACGDAGEVLQHGVHVGRVEGMAHPQSPGPASVRREVGGDRVDRVLVARDDQRGGAVDACYGDAVLLPCQQRQDLVLARLQRDHGSAGGKGGHQPAACGDQRAGVPQGEHARRVRGGELADGVAGDVVGAQAPRLDEAEQCHFEREEGGLGVGGVVEQRGLGRARLGEQHVAHGAVQLGVEAGQDGVQRVGVHREPVVELPAHLWPLAALAGEQEREPAPAGAAGDEVAVGRAVTQGLQGPYERVALGGDHGRAVVQARPGGGQRAGQVGQGQCGLGFDERQQSLRLRPQRRLGACGEHQGYGAGLGGGLCFRFLGGRFGGLFEDGVDVGAAESEGGDAGAARAAGLRPFALLGQQADGA